MDYKEIPGFPRYGISTDGEIKNFESGRILKPNRNKNDNYLRIWLINIKGESKKCSIHVLMGITYLDHFPCGMKIVVHHKNDICFDNRLENLELLTNGENISKSKKKSSKYPGVCWANNQKKWKVQIGINGKRKYLGYFLTEEEAHQAYLKALDGIN